MKRDDRPGLLHSAYDGPVPPAGLAALRWGAGAWERLARGADAAIVEARLREIIGVLGRLRRSTGSTADLRRLVRAVAQCRDAALG